MVLLQQFDRKIIPIAMKALSILTLLTFVADIYSGYYASIIWNAMYGSYRTFIDLWLPGVFYLVYWPTLVICAWKDIRIILLAIPFVMIKLFPMSLWYIYTYHTNIGSLYYPGQALAVFSIIAMTLGLILLILSTIIYLKKNKNKLSNRYQQMKKSLGKWNV